MGTHEVVNQATPLVGHDVAAADVALMDGVAAFGGDWGLPDLVSWGRRAGDPEVVRWGELANEHEPVLHRYDRFGHRTDIVEYHPAYHALMTEAVAGGLHAAPWADERPGAHVVRAARFAVWTQVEAGHGCPISMTYSIVPALRADAELAAEWEPLLTSASYDADDEPAAAKTGALAGMAMTEKQGGSDVRANTTRAEPGDGGYVLTGHKWFCSAPMSDVFLMLAQTPAGLSCFVVPRWRPDGTRNAIRIERLKDKLGNRSNASSEIELDGAWGSLLGDDGGGVATIIRMVNHTRLDCVIGVTGQMRAGLTQAIHHTRHRTAFGKHLVDQPLMRQVLADLAVESEAATVTMLRLAAAYDAGDEVFSRLATAVEQVLVLQAHADVRRRSAGVLRRQRLRGDRPDGPVVPGEPAQRHLGGQRQRDRPRRPAGDRPEPDSLTALLAEIETAPVPTADSISSSLICTPNSPSSARVNRKRRDGASRSVSPSRCRARCCCATPFLPSPMPSAHRASHARVD